jgi:tetratricopeptide (TPR) repeat protein
MMTEESSMMHTVANSIATDPNRSAAVVTSGGFRSSASNAIGRAVQHPEIVETNRHKSPVISPITPRTVEDSIEEPDEDDPDFEEALRIQQRALRFLAAKQYRKAIEEFSAALFLVPDDPYLSPELHLGRAHALNGSRRHESARIDALLAVKKNPTPEAYSTLAKSEFYLHDYLAAIEAFEKCSELLPEGETLSMFDQAYLEKANAAYREELEHEHTHDDTHSVISMRSAKSVVPKLPPPRFVPREEVSCGD